MLDVLVDTAGCSKSKYRRLGPLLGGWVQGSHDTNLSHASIMAFKHLLGLNMQLKCSDSLTVDYIYILFAEMLWQRLH